MTTEELKKRIDSETEGLPARWREVLYSALLNTEHPTDAELCIQSALAVHSKYPADMEPAEAILAGDALIPLAVESMLDKDYPLEEIEAFLKRAAKLFNK